MSAEILLRVLTKPKVDEFNPCPAEQEKPTDLDLHCLSFCMWIYINDLDQAIWLAKNWE